MNSGQNLLRIQGLCKSYAAPVLADFDFELHEAEVHALVGANGAGKSTLARIIAGLTLPEAGEMSLGGDPFAPRLKRDAERRGVHLVMQELNLIGTLSVAENIFLDRMPRRGGVIMNRRLHALAREALATVGLEDLDPAMPVEDLGIGVQQLIEIAAALSRECQLLILDEPTAALTDPQIDLLFEHIGRLKSEGVGILYISHRMEEIQRIADRVTVLRDGRVVDTRPAATSSVDELVRLMVGRELVGEVDVGHRESGDIAMHVENLCRGELVREVTFTVHRGEILGFAGLVGSGRTETMRAIFGADRPDSGAIFMGPDEEVIRIRQPADAVRAGIGMIPEDRKEDGLLLTQPITTNITLANLVMCSRAGGWIDVDRECEVTMDSCDRLHVQMSSLEQSAEELSGGNQQKVVVARWLLRGCDVLLFDEPTRGIDIAAKRTMYTLFDELARSGVAIVVVSSDLLELLAMADRIAVMSAGRLVKTFSRGEWTQEKIMAAAFSGYLNRDNSLEMK